MVLRFFLLPAGTAGLSLTNHRERWLGTPKRYVSRAPHFYHLSAAPNARSWRIALFRCAAEFGRYRGIADIGQARTDQTRFTSTRPNLRRHGLLRGACHRRTRPAPLMVVAGGAKHRPDGAGVRGAVVLTCLTGKSVRCLSSPIFKNIPVFAGPKSPLELPPSRPTRRGVSRSSRTRGGMRWTRLCWLCRRSVEFRARHRRARQPTA